MSETPFLGLSRKRRKMVRPLPLCWQGLSSAFAAGHYEFTPGPLRPPCPAVDLLVLTLLPSPLVQVQYRPFPEGEEKPSSWLQQLAGWLAGLAPRPGQSAGNTKELETLRTMLARRETEQGTSPSHAPLEEQGAGAESSSGEEGDLFAQAVWAWQALSGEGGPGQAGERAGGDGGHGHEAASPEAGRAHSQGSGDKKHAGSEGHPKEADRTALFKQVSWEMGEGGWVDTVVQGLRHVFVLLVALASHILLVFQASCTSSLSNLADLATSRLSAWRHHPPVRAGGWCRAKMLCAPGPCWLVWRAWRGSGARGSRPGCLPMRRRWRGRWRTWPGPRRRGRRRSSAHRSN